MNYSLLNLVVFFLFYGGIHLTEAVADSSNTYVIQSGDTPSGVARKFDIDMDVLLRFNSHVSTSTFPVGTTLDIPSGRGRHRGDGSTHVVSSGDTLAQIARFYGVSIAELRRLNNLSANDHLQLGAKLQIPRALRGNARGHVVQQGDTLSAVAQKHKVSVSNLASANRISPDAPLEIGRTLVIPNDDDTSITQRPKRNNNLVKSGQKIPGGVAHTVMAGQNLWTIARAYNVDKKRIAKRNKMKLSDPIDVGDRLIIPGATAVVPVRVKGFAVQPVRFVRVKNNKAITLKLIGKGGSVNQRARKRLSYFTAPIHPRDRKGLRFFHPRLIHMLQRVSERWPGRTFEIISGYRSRARGSESYHGKGQAIDFRVQGVSNREAYEFCTQLPNSGCGYYPNSVFIHMDYRRKSTTWTDYSRPGEAAQYHETSTGHDVAADDENESSSPETEDAPEE